MSRYKVHNNDIVTLVIVLTLVLLTYNLVFGTPFAAMGLLLCGLFIGWIGNAE